MLSHRFLDSVYHQAVKDKGEWGGPSGWCPLLHGAKALWRQRPALKLLCLLCPKPKGG